MPSPPSPLHPCPYCEILGHGKVEFSSEDLLETHGVQKHPGWSIHSKPDIEKFRETKS
jgi:DNA-binding helix-hairpin-helix protein with protein kinase domain